jgi:hypothetical protein
MTFPFVQEDQWTSKWDDMLEYTMMRGIALVTIRP